VFLKAYSQNPTEDQAALDVRVAEKHAQIVGQGVDVG